MKKIVYQILCKVFTVILLVVGVGAICGGVYAHGYVTAQLKEQKITMPEGDSIKADVPGMKEALEPYAGQPMTTGPQAQAYADHYIKVHMDASSGGKQFEEVSANKMKVCKGDPKSEECQKATALRTSFIEGNSIRGMLLNAYGWWLLGTIAMWAGIAAIVLAVILGLLGFLFIKPASKVSRS